LWPVYTAPASDNDSTNRYMFATSPLKFETPRFLFAAT